MQNDVMLVLIWWVRQTLDTKAKENEDEKCGNDSVSCNQLRDGWRIYLLICFQHTDGRRSGFGQR
jgi:hypothetical protein